MNICPARTAVSSRRFASRTANCSQHFYPAPQRARLSAMAAAGVAASARMKGKARLSAKWWTAPRGRQNPYPRPARHAFYRSPAPCIAKTPGEHDTRSRRTSGALATVIAFLREDGMSSRIRRCTPALLREKEMILVTGASGTVGKEVLKQVAKTGAKYCAMFRSPEDAKSAAAGSESVIADFARKETLPAALRGVESMYLVCSPIPDLVQLESNVIDACAGAGVKHVVLNSALGAGDYDQSFPSWHRKVEDRLRQTRLSWTILRPNSFHQNTVAYYAPSIPQGGSLLQFARRFADELRGCTRCGRGRRCDSKRRRARREDLRAQWTGSSQFERDRGQDRKALPTRGKICGHSDGSAA